MRISLLLLLLAGCLSGCSTVKHWMQTESQQLGKPHHVVKAKPISHQPDIIIANLADESS